MSNPGARAPRCAPPLPPAEHAALVRRARAALFDDEWSTSRWESTYARVAQEVRAALTPAEREQLLKVRPYGVKRDAIWQGRG